jgi:5'-nucleotidase (lipoprotein e(P4) family)
MNDRRIFFLLVLSLSIFPACATRPRAQAPAPGAGSAPACRDASEYLQATLWVQTSPEYRVVAESTYRYASQALDTLLKDKRQTAALEQTDDFYNLPAAVVMDVDETVLNNSACQARMALNDSPYDAKLWSDWVARAAAPPIPGALEFVRHAASLGIEVFFVTNRTAGEEAATRKNLLSQGFPVHEKPDSLLLKDERPEWGSDKSSRRAYLARSYRILMLVGDDLGDFLSFDKAGPEERVRLAEANRARWGSVWFMLPNPQYGSWEHATYGYQQGLTDRRILEAKKAALRPFY